MHKKENFLHAYYTTMATLAAQLVMYLLMATQNAKFWDSLGLSNHIKYFINNETNPVSNFMFLAGIFCVVALLSEKEPLGKEENALLFLCLIILAVTFVTERVLIQYDMEISIHPTFGTATDLVEKRTLLLPFDVRILTTPISALVLLLAGKKVGGAAKLWSKKRFLWYLFLLVAFHISYFYTSGKTTVELPKPLE